MSQRDPEEEAIKALLDTLSTAAYYVGVKEALEKAKTALTPLPGMPAPTTEEALALLNELTPRDFTPPAKRKSPLDTPFGKL